jgi:putative phosphoesterase
MKIGLLSDTHGWLDPQVLDYFEKCDEIWHAGDVGDIQVLAALEAFKPVRAVYGNIDGAALRACYPLHQRFICEETKVWMTHIGGTPPRYTSEVLLALQEDPPQLFICGHSHILKVMRDPRQGNMWYLNPGAIGRQGFHQKRTLLRFELERGSLSHLEVVDLGFRHSIPAI